MRTATVTALALALALALSSVVACGGGKGDGAAAVAVTGAPAGTVVEVDGAVTATRAGAARPLAVGDRVHDDDVIATGTGRVAIQLDRNHVVWRLGPRLQQQVAQSSAWSAPMASADLVAATDEHSAAAGRHAEREAADTATSAVEDRAAPVPAAAAAPLAQVAPPAMPAPDPEPEAAPVPGAAGGHTRSRGGAGGGGAAKDMADDLAAGAPAPPPPPPSPEPPPPPPLDELVTGGERDVRVATLSATADLKTSDGDDGAPDPTIDKTSTSSATGGGASTAAKVAPKPPASGGSLTLGKVVVRGPLSRATVESRLAARARVLAACGTPEPSGTVLLTFTVTPAGTVDAVGGARASAELRACVAARLRGLTFGAAPAATKVTVSMTIK